MWKETDRCYIVAEIGGNFTDLETAKLLIDQAAECKVDAVKLQTYRAETITSKEAVFDMENIGNISQQEYFKKFEISEEMHKEIFDYAKQKGLDVFSTPSHITDVEMLEKFHPDVYKIGADDLTNLPFLKEIAGFHKPIMLSTGMSTMEEIRAAADAILAEGNRDIIIMHVVSLYPTAPEYVNLNAIRTLQKEFPLFTIGYSDHTLGVDSCIFAAVMGAKVIEKHFTYDKKADGPDHILSATKDEMKHLVDQVRLFETMRGSGIKAPAGDEIKNRINNRKSIVVSRNVKKGECLTTDNTDIKRPGTGIAPKYLETVLGKCVKCDLEADTLLKWSDI